ncbi:hypothetical protein ACP70R_029496 [Stipagrostis hirtigluma subsp. patula]
MAMLQRSAAPGWAVLRRSATVGRSPPPPPSIGP